jgi:hypothetical protein
MFELLFFTLVAIASLQAEEPVLPPEAVPLLPDRPLQTLDDQLHADHLSDMMTLCFSHPQMTGFVIWGSW